MKTIEKLIGDTQIAEVGTVAQSISTVSDSNDWSNDAYLSGVMGTLKEEERKLSLAINRDKAISDLDTKDKNRSSAARSIFYLNKGYLHYPNAEIVYAATIIETKLSKYGLKIASENYATETAHIESLLLDLSTDECLAAIALLPGLGDCIAQLVTTESDFVTSYVAFEEAKADQSEYDNATSIKKVVLKIINDELVVYLRAMCLSLPGTYETFASAVAQIIYDSNVTVKKRRNNNGK